MKSGIEVKVAKTAGFCFGVRRAVEQAQRATEENKGRIYSYGELIHNPQEVERLRRSGIIPIYEMEDISEGTVIIRTHGVREEIIHILKSKKVEIIDLTCPYVKKIHNIAKKYCQDGYKIVIIGDKSHPEVVGIRGWCERSVVVAAKEDVAQAISEDDKICVVAQTTIGIQMWKQVVDMIKTVSPEAVVFDTVCSATQERQAEAVGIASVADLMLVVGGKSSANTRKLYELCKVVCKRTFYIEHAGEIPCVDDSDIQIVGITAGASTPGHIIKEVIDTMEENNVISTEELSFAEAFEQSLKSLNTGDTVTGTVMEIRMNEIVVDLGFKSDGIIPLSELTDDPTLLPSDIVKVGDEITAYVVRVNDVEGQVTLSKKKAEFDKNYRVVLAAYETGEVLSGKVIEVMKAGVQVLVSGVRIFVPASQSSDRFMADLEVLKGTDVQLRIIDVNDRRRRITGSIKSVLKEENQKKREIFWGDVAEGKQYTGVVKSLTDFGVFVDIGGVDGLVHITELSWKNIRHPSDVVKEGDTIEVFIKSIDREKGKISLGYKKDEDNPWEAFKAKYKVGDVVTGKAVRIVPFGVFVDVDGVDGLIHISELSWRRINHPGEVVKENQVIEAYIKDIDYDKKKVSLGYKKIEDNPWEVFKNKYHEEDVVSCKIVRITTFGAFAEIIEGVDGLIHISQISNEKIGKVQDKLSVGDQVDAKITEIKMDTGKVSLSIRALLAQEEESVTAEPANQSGDEASLGNVKSQESATKGEEEVGITTMEAAFGDIQVAQEEPAEEEKPKRGRKKKEDTSAPEEAGQE